MLSDAAEQAMVESLAGLMLMLEDAGDELIHPDMVVSWMEYVSRRLNLLSQPDRRTLVALCRARMDQMGDPWMRRALESLYSGCGLEHVNKRLEAGNV